MVNGGPLGILLALFCGKIKCLAGLSMHSHFKGLIFP